LPPKPEKPVMEPEIEGEHENKELESQPKDSVSSDEKTEKVFSISIQLK
jgi:hypothetical protein